MMARRYLFLAAVSVPLAWQPALADTTPNTWREPVTGMEFVSIPRGCFAMGSAKPRTMPATHHRTPLQDFTDAGRDEMPQHEACVDAFWMGKHEVRIEDWQQLMGEPPIKGETGTPVVGVTWEQAVAFAAALTEKSSGNSIFRIPTEAEWEYACRAGSKKDVPSPDNLPQFAWYGVPGQRVDRPTLVGKLRPNDFGLYDMLGNAWEWVQDSYQRDGYARHTLYNPVIENAGPDRVLRGGSHRTDPINMRCSKRAFYAVNATLPAFGFRLVRIAR